MASKSRTGTDISASALGWVYKQWTRKDLTLFLSHYGVSFAVGDTNNTLIDSLNQLAAQRGLTPKDRVAFFKAHKAGRRLPPRKALVRAPIAAPRLPQIADTLPADRAERPKTFLRPRDLTHTRNTHPVSSNHVASGPSTPKTTQAVITECIICFNLFEPAKILMRQPTSSCVHEVNICKPCLSTWISSRMEANLWTRIGCPAPPCGEYLEYGDIQEFAEPEVFAR